MSANNIEIKKLIIGTANFGFDYGAASGKQQLNSLEVKRILNLAAAKKIFTLDTAAAYGKSEKILGSYDLKGFNIITKIPPDIMIDNEIYKVLTNKIEKSLKNLNVQKLEALLVHQPKQLMGDNGKNLYMSLKNLKAQKLISKIGVSVNFPNDLDKLDGFHFDIVQLPMNIFDRRFEKSGWLFKLKERGVEIHARSAFLQGVLLSELDNLGIYFRRFYEHFEKFDNWIKHTNSYPLKACISHIMAYPEVSRIIVGIDNHTQLIEITKILNSNVAKAPGHLGFHDENLILPWNWKL